MRLEQASILASSVFNYTIVDDRGSTSEASGVNCLAAITITNSIVWAGSSSSPIGPVFRGSCSFEYSNIGPGVTPSGTNISVEPALGADPHLTPTSCCIDQGTAVPPGETLLSADFDNEQRPDIGADELR